MEIKTKLARKENYSKDTRSLSKIKYIVIHYTGNNGDTAKNNVDYFAREVISPVASAHLFVDENEVWQSVPFENQAWHCGGKSYYHPSCRNNNSVGVEICMLDRKGGLRQGSIDKAVEVTKWLMEKFNVPIENVVMHYQITHKSCPYPFVKNPNLWQAFKNACVEDDEMLSYEQFKDYMTRYRKELQDNDAGTWSSTDREWAINKGLIAGNGKDVNGQPNYMWEDLLTREQAVTLMHRLFNIMEK